jgi:RNA polymerase sigma factor (sigma-70 family)
MDATVIEPTDSQLLAEYVANRSEEAFRLLMRRYIDVIYAAASRQVRQADVAEDVTQAVFIVLARRAGNIRDSRVLAGWLMRVTGFCAKDALRSAARRRKHEQRVAAMAAHYAEEDQSASREELLEHLDGALDRLRAVDRTAIVLRYLRQQSITELSQTLGVTEQAAQKRVLRATQRLRKLLQADGAVLSAALLAGHAVAAPAGLAERACALALAKGSSVVAAAAIAKGAIKLMAWSAAKTAAAICIIAALVTVVPVVAVKVIQSRASVEAGQPVLTQVSVVAPVVAIATDSEPLASFDIRDMVTGKPLSDVVIEISPGWRQGPSTFGRTEADGKAKVPIPATTIQWLDVYASKPGYAPLQSGSGRQFLDDKLILDFQLRLEKSVPIGGRVLDQNGEPLQGATVLVIDRDAYADEGVVAWDQEVTTDARGSWTIDAVSENANNVEVGASHPMCYDDALNGAIGLVDMPIGPLRDHTSVIHLQRGTIVHGVVLGPDGKPRKAWIGLGDQRTPINVVPEFSTDDNGQFQFGAKAGIAVPIVVRADGLATQLIEVPPGKAEPLKLVLTPSTPLRVHVVDSLGHAIPNAVIAPDYWVNNFRYTRGVNEVMVTDQDGRATWNEAPGKEIYADVDAGGYLSRSNVGLQPGQDDQIQMLRRFLIRGRVIDADTGKPAEGFHVVEGITDSDWTGSTTSWTDYVGWEDRYVRHGPNGTFVISDDVQHDRTVVRVQGGNYVPTDSKPIVPDGRDHDIVVYAQKGPHIGGLLLDAKGNPLPNVQVCLQTAWLDVYDADLPVGDVDEKQDPEHYVTTDLAGQFFFPQQKGNFSLLAQTDAGYVLVKARRFKKSNILHLVPWAKVEGTVFLGDKPAVGDAVSGYYSEPDFQGGAGPFCHFNAKTDGQGHFEFPKAFAGQYNINGTTVTIPPGRTTQVAIHQTDTWGH